MGIVTVLDSLSLSDVSTLYNELYLPDNVI